ncbi:MAG: hypothetical protein NHB32_08460 [Fischerella sp. CENA71]|nr:hypothetical protein [Fischerella sp. CENA71]
MHIRKMNPKSLENLRLGAVSRKKGKVRVNVTILPETKQWLERSGNVSERIDDMVCKILKQELIGRHKLDTALQRIAELENEIKKK